MGIVYALIGLLAALLVLMLADRLLPARICRLAVGLDRWRSGLTEQRAAIPGFTMPYLTGGQGEPLVLIHGFGADKDSFTPISRFLTPHYRLICPDLPGFGAASRDPNARYAMADQVDRLHAFLVQLNLTKVHLGGSSMGGFIAAQYAVTYPELVASLWLLDAAGTAAAHESEMLKHYRDTGDVPLLVPTESAFDNLMRVTTYRPLFLPHSVRVTLARRAVGDYPLHREIMAQLHHGSPLLETQFHTMATPTCIVWGVEDKVLHPDGAQAFQALFPNSQVRMLPAIGHLPMLEAPKQVAMDYLGFRRTTCL